MSIFQIVGLFGFFTYLLSFAALQAKLIDGNGAVYALLNIAGASFVLISLTEAFNLASALIQMSWIIIGLCGLAFRQRNKSNIEPIRRTNPRLRPIPQTRSTG